jgi:hypothetical protein
MSQNVRVQCPTCRTWIVVMPPHVFEAVGDLWGIEGELGFRERRSLATRRRRATVLQSPTWTAATTALSAAIPDDCHPWTSCLWTERGPRPRPVQRAQGAFCRAFSASGMRGLEPPRGSQAPGGGCRDVAGSVSLAGETWPGGPPTRMAPSLQSRTFGHGLGTATTTRREERGSAHGCFFYGPAGPGATRSLAGDLPLDHLFDSADGVANVP